MLNLHASPTCSRIDTWGGDQARGHFRTLTHTLSSPLPLVPALTFLIRPRRQALLLPGRPQSSKPGAASAAAAAMLHPPTHIWQRLWHFLLSQHEGRCHQPPWVEAGGSYPTQVQIRSKSEGLALYQRVQLNSIFFRLQGSQREAVWWLGWERPPEARAFEHSFL